MVTLILNTSKILSYCNIFIRYLQARPIFNERKKFFSLALLFTSFFLLFYLCFINKYIYIYIYIYIWSFSSLFDLSCADKFSKSETVTARRLILYIYIYKKILQRRFRKDIEIFVGKNMFLIFI